MNSLGLIYKEIPLISTSEEIEVPSINNIYKTVRQHIKPQFKHWKLKANNLNGAGAGSFNRRLGRFKHDWLDFDILDFDVRPEHYPSEDQILESKILRDTAIADSSEWRKIVSEQIAEGRTYLLVGMEALLNQEDFRMSMLSYGLPSSSWPCKFRLFEFILTNAPICQNIRHKAHVIV